MENINLLANEIRKQGITSGLVLELHHDGYAVLEVSKDTVKRRSGFVETNMNDALDTLLEHPLVAGYFMQTQQLMTRLQLTGGFRASSTGDIYIRGKREYHHMRVFDYSILETD